MSQAKSPHPQKTPAASHMMVFFVLPCLGFIVWASWSLIGGLLEPKPQDIPSRIEAVKTAKSSGDRWQAVYALSQELQKMKTRGEWDSSVTNEQKKELFEALVEMQDQHAADLRFKKYVLLTLGQFGSPDVIPSVRKELDSSDEEIRFYAAWAFLEILNKDAEYRNEENLSVVRTWLKDKEPAFKKIAATFLVQHQQDNSNVKELLKDEGLEVRWNTAVALSSVGDEDAAGVLKEMFDLKQIRQMDLRSVEDLKQLISSAFEAAQKLGNNEVLNAAKELKAQVNASTPEGKAIHEAIPTRVQ